MGAHWHFVNFLSTLIGPAMIYIWARNVEKKRNKHYEEKEKERIMKPEILTNSQQNSIESAIEASKGELCIASARVDYFVLVLCTHPTSMLDFNNLKNRLSSCFI